MSYRRLGKSGLFVHPIALGTMQFGWSADEATSYAVMDAFVEAGGNLIDTADIYSNWVAGNPGGVSEEIIGRWMKSRGNRDRVLIATKVRGPMGQNGSEGRNHPLQREGLSRKWILRAAEDSLRRLQTDFIDLYQVHWVDNQVPIEETLSALTDLVRRGWVRYVGASNHTGWQLQKAIDTARQHGWESYTCLQPQYNLLSRGIEWELVPVCLNEGVGIIPWSPLRGGWLSGKYRRGMSAPPEGSRVDEAERQNWGEKWSNLNRESTWVVLDALHEVAQHTGRHPASVAINWLLQQPGVTAPIIGARNLEQLEPNLQASGWTLAPEHLQRLNEASQPQPTYPYDIADLSLAGR